MLTGLEGIIEAVVATALDKLGLPTALHLELEHIRCFIREIEHQYQVYLTTTNLLTYQNNPYHNAVHAADVVQCVFYFLTHGLYPFLGTTAYLDAFALILAAVCHDVGHPGMNNAFLVSTSDALAMEYNGLHNSNVFETYFLR